VLEARNPERAFVISKDRSPTILGKALVRAPRRNRAFSGLKAGFDLAGGQGEEPLATSDPDAAAIQRLSQNAHTMHIFEFRDRCHHAVRYHREVGDHPSLGVVFQPVEFALIDNQKVMRVLNEPMLKLKSKV
jgi:hypothetical protein